MTRCTSPSALEIVSMATHLLSGVSLFTLYKKEAVPSEPRLSVGFTDPTGSAPLILGSGSHPLIHTGKLRHRALEWLARGPMAGLVLEPGAQRSDQSGVFDSPCTSLGHSKRELQ